MHNNKKLRVGILTHNYPINSRERKDAGIFIYDFAHELCKYAEVFVFCPDFGGGKEKYIKVPVTWFYWDDKKEKFGNWKLFNPVYVYKFFKLIYIGQKKAIEFVKKNEIDYVLSCWTIPSGIFAWRVCSVLKVPYASWSLGSDVNKYSKIPILSQLIYFSLMSADNLYANSYTLVNKIKNISQRKVLFLPAITSFNVKSRIIKKIDRKFHFLFVGRLEFVKGPDLLINAVKIISVEYRDFVVDILGDGSMRSSLQLNAKDHSDYLKFYGWASEEKVSEFMSKSDSLIIASRNESLPLVLIEAAKKSLPVVTTDVGDCKRVVQKYKIGYSVKKENPTALARGMLRMMKSRGFKKEGFDELTKDFSQKKAVDIFLSNI